MDLFVINRFTGDDAISENADEQRKLAKILKNVEKRKRLRVQKKLKTVHSESRNKIAGLQSKTADAAQSFKSTTKPVEESEPACVRNSVDEKEPHLLARVNTESFKVLGTDQFTGKVHVKRKLPDWLLNPVVISGAIEKERLMKLKELGGVDKLIRDKLKSTGIKCFFPVQSMVIPFLLDSAKKQLMGIIPQDICVSAPTGSGKTLAYIIPLLQALKDCVFHSVRALVILPTQSLAVQIYATFRSFSEGLNVEIGLVTGGSALEKEQKQLVTHSSGWGVLSKVDILVCTPGRLVEHINCTKGFSLTTVQYLVIDEADRILDNIQDDWLYHLETHLQMPERTNKVFCNVHNATTAFRAQRLLFSATLSQDPEKLEKLNLFQPILYTSVISNNGSEHENCHFIGKYTMPTQLAEKYLVCSSETKPLALHKYIRDQNLTNVLVFTNTVDSVHRLRILLKALAPDLNIREVSSKLTLKKKNRLMRLFSSGVVDILVCTDSMARGIDLPQVNAVFSYAAPTHLKTYIHRVGRTARAGAAGVAVTLLEPRQKDNFLTMLKAAEKTTLEQIDLGVEELSLLSDQYQKALQTLKVQLELEAENTKIQVKKEKGLLKKRFGRVKCVKENDK